MHRFLFGLILALALGACGSKGPLYLPDSKPVPKSQAKPQPSSTDTRATPR